jgi:hypothetical protein
MINSSAYAEYGHKNMGTEIAALKNNIHTFISELNSLQKNAQTRMFLEL